MTMFFAEVIYTCARCEGTFFKDEMAPRKNRPRPVYCRSCSGQNRRESTERNAEQRREYQRNYNAQRKEATKERNSLYRMMYPERVKAHKAANRAGLLQQPCEVCGAVPAEMHHNDYSKPLEVRWLCNRHHQRLHHEV